MNSFDVINLFYNIYYDYQHTFFKIVSDMTYGANFCQVYISTAHDVDDYLCSDVSAMLFLAATVPD